MGRHSGSGSELAPEERTPEDYGHEEGHSPVTRRTVLGILAAAGAAAACVGGVSVVAIRPDSELEAESMPTGPPAKPVGLAAGAAGVTAPTSAMRPAYQRELSTSYSPQRAPRAPKTSAFFQGPTVLTLDQDLHAGRRLSYGLTPTLITQIRRVGRTDWIDSQLTVQQEDPELTALLRRYPLLTTPPAQIKAMFDADEGKPDDQKLDYHAVSDQLVEARLARSVWSRNQLHEKVCDVLRSVLHTPAYNDKIRMTVADFDRNVVQKYAYGRFADMLEAFRRHPAPRVYLDNQLSDGNSQDDQGVKINQNWGREWLELFTVRPTDYVTGKRNYDPRKDVVQMALLLSGLTFDEETQSSRYDPDMHYRGPIKVMTFAVANRDPAAGERLTQQVVQYLANHPSTATNLAADFARAFLVDAPPKDLVKRMAAAYTQSRTAIVPMLRVLLSSREFRLSVGQKYRTAEEYAAAGLRAFGARPAPDGEDALYQKTGTLNGLRDLTYQIGRLGGSSLQKDSPDGQAFHKAAWLSGFGTIERWNMALSFAGMYWKGIQRPELTTLYAARPRTYGEAVNALGRRLAFQPLAATTVTALLGFLGKTAASPVEDDLSLGGRLTQVVALILDAPEGLTYR